MAKRAKSTRPDDCPYVSKGGLKLAFALERLGVEPEGLVAIDLGCHKGGFTDCLLQHGAARVHAVDTGHGILDWKLRNDERVRVHERTNFLYWIAPEPADLIVIDGGWTPQCASLPAALQSLAPGGRILSLVKPQYEADKAELLRGVLPADRIDDVLNRLRAALAGRVAISAEVESPFQGSGGNTEWWFLLRPVRALE
jgi:23S rRNA (cytidine1920-2'-O)/16S rRNA (cytidine1409-2'-O)-methyltransferase